MPTRKTLKLLYVLTLIALFLLTPGCKYLKRADDPVLKEANKLESEADALSVKVDDAYKQVAQKDEEINAAKKDKARIKKLSDEELSLYDEATKNARDAADKYEQAGKLKVDAKYQEYLNLRGQYMRKHGAHIAALKEIVVGRLEAKPTKASRDKQAEAKSRSERLKKEMDELKAQADKLQKENGDKFKAA